MTETTPPPDSNDNTAPYGSAADEETIVQAPVVAKLGEKIGRYTLLEQLGEGGFGVVYLAEQTVPLRRRVALKVIKLGMDTREVIARFEAERQALALMDHPNIATVLDGGATEAGRPFFVMELVKGTPITEYCDRHRLSTTERLELFIHVCRAVQHAHQKGIIHRDLKPSNVLIAMQDGVPVPKVIDFGIAKATNQRLTEKTVFTQARQFIGTPEYMSPEQAGSDGMDIDTRSDVYSLGVLLYELLVGVTPFDSEALRSAAYAELQRMIVEEDPPRPSTRLSTLGASADTVARSRKQDVAHLSRTLRGDLDWIVMMALEKDRTRRYDTANDLASDIERHLGNQPVLASPPSAGYRVRKFVRRNTGAVVAASVIALLLIAGVTGTSLGLLSSVRANAALDTALADAREQRDLATTNADLARAEATRAEREAERARDAEADATLIADFQGSMLASTNPQAMGTAIVAGLEAEIRETLTAQGLDAADIDATLDAWTARTADANTTDVALGLLDEFVLQPAIAAVEADFPDQPRVSAQLDTTLARTYESLGLYQLGIPLAERAIVTARAGLGQDDLLTLDAMNQLAALQLQTGQFDETDATLAAVMEAVDRTGEHESYVAVTAMHNIVLLRNYQSRFDEALDLGRETLDLKRKVYGDEHDETASGLYLLATLEQRLGHVEASQPLYEEAARLWEDIHGRDHLNTLAAYNGLATLHYLRAEYEEAEALFRGMIDDCRTLLGDEHQMTLAVVSNLGMALMQLKRPADAEPYVRLALESRLTSLGPNHTDTLISTNALGKLLTELGRPEEGLPYNEQAIAGVMEILPDHWLASLFRINRGQTLAALGRFEEAEAEILGGHADFVEMLGADNNRTVTAIKAIVLLYEAWHEAAPDAGHDVTAAEWQGRLPEDG